MAWSALAAALWGGLYVASQLAFQDHLPPAILSVVRLAVGVVALLIALRRPPPLRSPRHWVLGVTVAVTLVVQSYGTYFSGAATGSLLTLLTPVFVAALAPLLIHERTRPLQWAGIAAGVAGAAVVVGPAGAGSLLGDALLVIASLTWALFTVVGTPLVRTEGALPVTAAGATLALPFMAVAAAAELALGARPTLTLGGALDVLYQGRGAPALAWWAWYRGVERAPAAAAAVPFLLQPVVGVALSIPIFHAPVTPGFVAGSVLVAAGMLLASRS